MKHYLFNWDNATDPLAETCCKVENVGASAPWKSMVRNEELKTGHANYDSQVGTTGIRLDAVSDKLFHLYEPREAKSNALKAAQTRNEKGERPEAERAIQQKANWAANKFKLRYAVHAFTDGENDWVGDRNGRPIDFVPIDNTYVMVRMAPGTDDGTYVTNVRPLTEAEEHAMRERMALTGDARIPYVGSVGGEAAADSTEGAAKQEDVDAIPEGSEA